MLNAVENVFRFLVTILSRENYELWKIKGVTDYWVLSFESPHNPLSCDMNSVEHVHGKQLLVKKK